MRRLFTIFACSLLLNVACVLNVPPTPPVPPTPNAHAVGLTVRDAHGPVAGARCDLDGAPRQPALSDANGTIVFQNVPLSLRATQLSCAADGYDAFSEHRDLTGADSEPSLIALLVRSHFDPSSLSLEQLAAIRGAMWTARLNVPFGPRSNQDSNILATAYYGLYDTATRARMLDAYLGKYYTHAVTGPITGNDCYHGLYPCRQGVPTQEQWDTYLDELQEWWDRGLAPVYFAKPDGWERAEFAADMDRLDALYRQPRAQKLLRIVVYPGWEPSGDKYGWDNAEYVRWVKRGAAVFPNALRGLHTAIDLDAPTGKDDDKTFPAGQGNAISWVNVAPYIHFWADQLGGYVFGGEEVPPARFLDELCKHVQRVKRGFHEGYGGWPTFSAWGQRPIRHIVSEYAAYANFWWNWHERHALQIGDHAMSCGADGYLDGGTVPVPVNR